MLTHWFPLTTRTVQDSTLNRSKMCTGYEIPLPVSPQFPRLRLRLVLCRCAIIGAENSTFGKSVGVHVKASTILQVTVLLVKLVCPGFRTREQQERSSILLNPKPVWFKNVKHGSPNQRTSSVWCRGELDQFSLSWPNNFPVGFSSGLVFFLNWTVSMPNFHQLSDFLLYQSHLFFYCACYQSITRVSLIIFMILISCRYWFIFYIFSGYNCSRV